MRAPTKTRVEHLYNTMMNFLVIFLAAIMCGLAGMMISLGLTAVFEINNPAIWIPMTALGGVIGAVWSALCCCAIMYS